MYPTEEQLDQIRNWKDSDYTGLLQFLRSLWTYPYSFILTDHSLELHTMGWSGNENIISALQETFFWVFHWAKSERGGHYYFDDSMVDCKWTK